MMNKVAVGLLAFGLALFLPALRASVRQIGFEGLWLEFGLWCLGLGALFAACFQESTFARSEKRRTDSLPYLHLVLIPAISALIWGLYSEVAVWTLVGWCMGICILIGIALRLAPTRLVHLSLFAFLIPISLWPFAAEMHLIAQRISTFLAGSILDLCKVFFFTRGNVIGLVNNDFLLTQQCAGIRLLGQVLLALFVYGFFWKYSWFRAAYLLVVGAFWVLVFNAMRIAYVAWLQDGQSALVTVNESMLDAICMLCVMFLSTSADQFFAAFSEKSIDSEKDDTSQQIKSPDPGSAVEPIASQAGASVALWLCFVSLLAVGAWQFYLGLSGPSVAYNGQEIQAAVDQLALDSPIEGWSLERSTPTYESLIPVFSNRVHFPVRQWELKNDNQQSTKMRMRIDGIWLTPPRSDWLWRWFGWQTDTPTIDPQGSVSWGMSRSIVEEGFVVSKSIVMDGGYAVVRPTIQLSLVQEGFSPIPELQRIQQRSLFEKLIEAIELQSQGRLSGQSKGQQGP